VINNAQLSQAFIGAPFLYAHPVIYVANAFNMGRVFLHVWTVNWRFMPERVFVDPRFHIALLAAHLLVLVTFASYAWFRYARLLSVLCMHVLRRRHGGVGLWTSLAVRRKSLDANGKIFQQVFMFF
jgi:alpha-1,3-mannosyltransferase